MIKKIKVLSLFDGISCGAVALERAGYEIERYVAFEIDEHAIKISKKNYPFIEHKGDVFDGDYTQYKGFDILIGGSPCTYWSIARNGRETTSDGIGYQLFMQYSRALRESGCRYFLYENNYSIHADIKAAITAELGVKEIVINSALVSAQNRRRCYWTNIPNIEQPLDRKIVIKDILQFGGGLIQNDGETYEPVIIQRPHGFNKGGIKHDKAPTLTSSHYEQNNKVVEPVIIGYQLISHEQTTATPDKLGDIYGGGQGNRLYSVSGKGVSQTSSGGGHGGSTGLYAIPIISTRQSTDKMGCLRATYYKIGKRNLEKNLTDGLGYEGIIEPVSVGSCLENMITAIVKKYGYLPQQFNVYNKKEICDKAPSQTTGSLVTSSNAVLTIEPCVLLKELQERLIVELDKNIYIVLDGHITINDKQYPVKLPDGLYIIRKLTPIECERLQTLPDDYTLGISDTQRYKAVGNGWTVDVITHILQNLLTEVNKNV